MHTTRQFGPQTSLLLPSAEQAGLMHTTSRAIQAGMPYDVADELWVRLCWCRVYKLIHGSYAWAVKRQGGTGVAAFQCLLLLLLDCARLHHLVILPQLLAMSILAELCNDNLLHPL